MQFCLIPIERIARKFPVKGIDDDDFDESIVPIEIMEGARVEDVSSLISEDEFSIHRQHLGTELVEKLETMKYAVIHRFPEYEIHEDEPDPTKRFVDGTSLLERSQNIVAEIAACLKLIRPTPQHTQMCWGKVNDNGGLYDIAFSHPFEYVTVPENQKFFRVRTSDINDLISYSPLFRKAMHGPYWKFRMAVQMHEAGHIQNGDWKARYFLWTAALESLFTTQRREHKGSLVASERIKDLLGANTLIYPPGELISLDPPSSLTVGDVVRDIYCLRNNIAHGDKVPDAYTQEEGRKSFEDSSINKLNMLMEAISFITRSCLLKILKDGLVQHFGDSQTSEQYFSAKGLTSSQLPKHAHRCAE